MFDENNNFKNVQVLHHLSNFHTPFFTGIHFQLMFQRINSHKTESGNTKFLPKPVLPLSTEPCRMWTKDGTFFTSLKLAHLF